MKCQILFSGKNKKNISNCRLLKFLPRVLRVKEASTSKIFCVYTIEGQGLLLKERVCSLYELPYFGSNTRENFQEFSLVK